MTTEGYITFIAFAYKLHNSPTKHSDLTAVESSIKTLYTSYVYVTSTLTHRTWCRLVHFKIYVYTYLCKRPFMEGSTPEDDVVGPNKSSADSHLKILY
jgi:hypothetical protein